MHNSFTSEAYMYKKMATRQHKKVILVEDNLADVELVKISVGELTMPVELIHVGDGQELLRFLKTSTALNDIGVILLDLNMPRVSGLDVLRYMHKDPVLNKIPVVMFTTSNSRADIMKCYELGAKAFVCKPLDINDFNDSIRSIVEFWTSVNILPVVN
jgi:CheY-like chemotaxis protein